MNNYYCVLPYYSMEIDLYNPSKNQFCCRLDKNTVIDDVRQSIQNGQRAKECSTCWNLENNKLTSERMIHNANLDYLLDVSIENLETQSLKNGFDPKIIKLTTSNLCNGQCVTCSPALSSSWAKLKNLNSQYKSLNLDNLDIDWASIVSLSFVGGEPLLEKKNFSLLEKLVECNNTNCFISIVTNGSISLTTNQIKILEKFTNLNICLSIDGIEKRFEYMRFPLSWDLLLKNLAMFKSIAKYVSVSSMISNLNIFYYSELVDFFKKQNINYLCKQVTDPSIFLPGNLPERIKDAVRENNQRYLNEVNSFLSIADGEKFDMLIQEIKYQDNLKKISISDYMPEMARLITNT